ncbi:MAG TPA: type IX secretion system membrane protein PorP/SprF [Bacteroidia bacterium]
MRKQKHLFRAPGKKFLLLKLFLLLASAGEAQQLALYSQFMVNDYVMNPAIGGRHDYFEAMSANRYQWIGITDAPRTYILSVNGPGKRKNIGLGGYLFTDIVGPTRRIGVDFTYAYHAKLSDNIKLSLGLSAGILQFAVDGSKITLHDPVDLVISNGYQSVLLPDFGAGFYLYGPNWWFGSAVPQIYPARIKFFDYTSDSQGKLSTHSYTMGGYKFHVGDDFIVEPSFLVKYVYPAPVQLDLGLRCIYKEKMWVGGGFRTMDAFSVMAGYVYEQNLSVSYSYDFTTTNIRNYSTGTHEIVLSIRFGKTQTSGSGNNSRIE